MEKQQILSLLSTYIKSGTVTKEEVLTLLNSNSENPISSTVSTNNPESAMFEGKNHFSATNILYTVGGLILLIGIGTLLFRFWDDLSSTIRIAITLGLAVVFYISGILLRSDNKTTGIGVIAQVISGFLFPIGIFITLNEMHVQNIDIGTMTVVSVSLAIFYVLSLILFRSIVFSFYSIAYGTWAIYSIVAYALTETSGVITYDIYKYLTLALGVGYLFLSSYVKGTSHKALSQTLDSFGSIGFFSAILVLGDYSPNQSMLWEFIGVLSLCGGLYLASTTHNRTILKTTSLFIFIFIGKFTGEYFVDSFGWPIALIISGLVLIGAGYGLLKFNKRIKV